jgi:hypothetical protein
MITFTTTATVRPELINSTYTNFSKNLTGINLNSCKLIINIDPVPEDNIKEKLKIIEIGKKYFGEVKYNFPSAGNFPNALKWVWENVDTEYVFNLEDDWELLTTVDLLHLIRILEKNPKAIGISLNAYLFAMNPFRIRLSPGLFRGSWVKKASSFLKPTGCPEKQLRSKLPSELKGPMLNFPEYNAPKQGKIIVRDTGRAWREKKKLIKNSENSNVGFTTWKKK